MHTEIKNVLDVEEMEWEAAERSTETTRQKSIQIYAWDEFELESLCLTMWKIQCQMRLKHVLHMRYWEKSEMEVVRNKINTAVEKGERGNEMKGSVERAPTYMNDEHSHFLLKIGLPSLFHNLSLMFQTSVQIVWK